MRLWTSVLLVAMGASGFGGCDSSDSSEFECSTFSACGGDIQGTWVLLESCGNTSTHPACAYLEQNNPRPKNTGTLTFEGGRLSSVVTTVPFDYEYVLTTPCLAEMLGGMSVAMDQVCASLSSSTRNAAGTDESTHTCTWNEDVCMCREHVAADTFTSSGEYRVTGNQLTVTTDEGVTSMSSFCVSGNFLTVGASNDSGEASSSYSAFRRR